MSPPESDDNAAITLMKACSLGKRMRGGSNAFDDRGRQSGCHAVGLFVEPAAAKKSKMGCEIGREYWDAAEGKCMPARAPRRARRRQEGRVGPAVAAGAHHCSQPAGARPRPPAPCPAARRAERSRGLKLQDEAAQHALTPPCAATTRRARPRAATRHALATGPGSSRRRAAASPICRLARGEALRVLTRAARPAARPPSARSGSRVSRSSVR